MSHIHRSQSEETKIEKCTYINHPILRRMSVRAAHIESIAIPHRLDHPYVIPAIEVLRKERKKIEFLTDTNEETRPGGEGEESLMRGHGFFRELYRTESKERVSPVIDRVVRVFRARVDARRKSKLVLSSRREYLRGPYTFTSVYAMNTNEAVISDGLRQNESEIVGFGIPLRVLNMTRSRKSNGIKITTIFYNHFSFY